VSSKERPLAIEWVLDEDRSEGTTMLARYKIYRVPRPPSDPLPTGVRQDSRWRTKHPLRPTEQMVKEYLASPDETAWGKFRKAYFELLTRRFRGDRMPFDKLADLATETDVFLGCSCKTKVNPRIDRCHTFLALQFMKRKYPNLRVEFPRVDD
jgi:hypothetical protein